MPPVPSPSHADLRRVVTQQAAGAVALQIAYIGVVRGLFATLHTQASPVDAAGLASAAGVDAGYVRRWCEAAYAFGQLDLDDSRFSLTDLGRAFLPDAPGTLMPFAIQAAMAGHMAERAARLMLTGERPGEAVLSERADIVPWYGPMMEVNHADFFEQDILPEVPEYGEAASGGRVVVDLGCGTGWYLRRIATRYPSMRGVGLDQFPANIDEATRRSREAALDDRLQFSLGDIYHFAVDEPVGLIAMNRSLHHVWDDRERVFSQVFEQLVPGGAVVIWEPRWPDDLSELRAPDRRAVAFQNLSEHIQGNHFLRRSQVEGALRAAGLQPRTLLVAGGREMVVVGKRVA